MVVEPYFYIREDWGNIFFPLGDKKPMEEKKSS